jgi:septal ring factor EnvC (AmiA/AmiB activator)
VLLGLVSYYGYLSYEVNKLEKKVRIKEKEKKIYLKKLKFFKTALKKKEEEIEKLLHEDKNLQKNLKNILVRLNFLEKKEKYSFYNQLAKIVSLLKKNNLKIISFEKENHHYVIYIKSKYDISKNIAQFMKDLYKNNFINIKSNYAQLNVEKGKSYYVSKVEFDEYK